MLKRLLSLLAAVLLVAPAAPALADDYQDTINVFKQAGESSTFFKSAYGYAVFPTIGKAGFVVGAAGGKGRVYVKGKHVGDSTMAQASIGWLAGAEAYSQIIFFEDERAFREFSKGNFEFGAEASVTAITAGASAKAATTGSSASASAGQHDAKTAGKYYKGMATFMVVKGGLMGDASVKGQKYSYTAVGAAKK
ncbi:MAG: lipid-binding SYLF domain-containing protein [Betaproteobacteria bacterium]|jgi:lipid-binding SYLF domain-containing protein|nr:lipid-binding SYLF domain-containing protein [Betaproteobacteria bacterium]MDH5287252.1 lipid-binding SYLF domain-containing protein [Betaproteobacteria bacterium]